MTSFEARLINLVTQEGPDSRVGSACGDGSGVPWTWIESRHGKLLHLERKNYLGYSP